MKKIISIMLVILLFANVSFAEASKEREMTPEEQAYNIYLDIACVHEYGVRYLEEMGRIWEIALSAKDVDAVNDLSYMDCFPQVQMFSLISLLTDKYGYTSDELSLRILNSNVFSVTEKTDLVWAILALEEESGYLKSPSVLKVCLDRAFDNIRTLMAVDKEYAFLSELKDYYKDAVLLYEYIADFKDNYTGFSEKFDDFKSGEKSWKVDFEFIFAPDAYPYVSEIRALQQEYEKKKIYDLAVALENSGDYAGAIEQYWQCGFYEDAANRITVCRNNILETNYQTATIHEQNGNYKDAIDIYSSLRDYKDSQERFNFCSYQYALSLEAEGKFEAARHVYNTILSYEDSASKSKSCQVWEKYLEPYGIKIGTKMTIHDWGIGEVVKLFDTVGSGSESTTSVGTTKTYTYVTIWVNYPDKGEVWHHIPYHFDYGLKVIPDND